MRAQGLGVVLKVGKGSKFKVGDIVLGAFGMSSFHRLSHFVILKAFLSKGWTEYAVMNDKSLEKITFVFFPQLL